MPCELLEFGQRITSYGVFYPYLILQLFSEFCVVSREIYVCSATFRILFYELIIILKTVFT